MLTKVFIKGKLNYVVLIIIIIALLYPVSFLVYSMKWDSLSCCLPWRFMVSESIHHGYLPWWNPYQSLGYPLHADMQITPWYLPVWIVSLFTPYTLVFVQYEYVTHIIIAGIGMFWFLKTLKVDTFGCFIISISYSLSGVMIGNAQHYHHIVTAAWLPFVIGSFYHLLKNPSIYHILIFSLFSWLIVTGGYIGLLIVLVYTLVLWFFIYQFFYYKRTKKVDFSVFKACLTSFFLIFLLCLPQFVSIFQSLPFVSKQNGIPLETALFGAYTPRSFISFLLPYATVKNSDWLGTDISMANIYFGIFTLCLAFLGIFHSNRIKWVFIAVVLISLMTSMGKDSPLRPLFYHYVPLMNFSRFPAIYRIFTIISFLFLAVLGWKLMEKDFKKNIKILRFIFLTALVVILGFYIYFSLNTHFSIKKFLLYGAFKENGFIGIKNHILFQSIIQMMLLGGLFIFSFLFKTKRIFLWTMVIFVIIDFAISINLNIPYTVISQGSSFSKVNESRKVYEYGFKKTHDYKVCETDSICRSVFTSYLSVNTATLNKHVTPNAFTSFLLNDFADILDNKPIYLDSIIKNKIGFLTRDIRKVNNIGEDYKNLNFKSITIYSDVTMEKTADTILIGSVENIKINPSEISMDINTNSNAVLVLLQSYYPYWKVFVDGKEYPLIKVSKAFMGVNINKGSKHVAFKYENKAVWYTFIISIVFLIILFIGLIYFRKGNTTRLFPSENL